MASTKDALKWIEELWKAHKAIDESRRSERIKSLELALKEQRRDYDVLHSLHEGIKVRNVTFLAAALGLLAYLYTGDNGAHNLRERLFIPPQAYGVIFYGAGFVLVVAAVAAIMVALIKDRQWKTAYENSQEDDLMDDYEHYLKYMHKRYLTVSKNNSKSYEQRRYLLNISFMPLLLGGTILVVLKTFGT